MPAIISEKFRIFNAKQFLESLSEGSGDQDDNRSRMYFFVGRPQPWKAFLEFYDKDTTNFSVGETITASGGFNAIVSEVYPNSLLLTDVGPSPATQPAFGATITGGTSGTTAKVGVYRYADENTPTAPYDNQEEKYELYDDIIALKRITSTYARHVVRRYNWDLGVNPVFDMWMPDYTDQKLTATGQSSLSQGKYAVMNAQYEVFTCVYNGTTPSNLSGQNATYPPSTNPVPGQGTYSSGIYSETDGSGNILAGTAGYVWKYMYTIPTDDVIKFLSSDFMPISTYQGSTPVSGNILTALVKSVGSNLPTSTTLYAAIRGDGTSGKVKITTTAGGSISTVSVIDGGSDYTYANIVLENGFLYTDTNLTTLATVNASATGDIEVIIPPQGGYGFDPVIELNSKRIMTNIRLTYAEGFGDFPVDNDFRRIGIIQDPIQFGSSSFLASETASSLYAVKINGATNEYTIDEQITQTVGGVVSKGRVVSWTRDTGNTGPGGNGILKYIQIPSEHSVDGVVNSFVSNGTDAIVGVDSGASGTVNTTTSGVFLGATFSSGLASPEIKNNSGEVIYVENRRLITRAPDQIEDIKLVIEF